MHLFALAKNQIPSGGDPETSSGWQVFGAKAACRQRADAGDFVAACPFNAGKQAECKKWDKSARSGLRAKCGAFPPVAIATDGGKRRHVDGEQPRESPANLYTINLP